MAHHTPIFSLCDVMVLFVADTVSQASLLMTVISLEMTCVGSQSQCLTLATQQAFWFGLALLVWVWLHSRQCWGRGCFKCSWQWTGLDRRCPNWMVAWIFCHSVFLSQWICVLPLFDILIVYLHSLHKHFMGCLHPQYHHWVYWVSVLMSDII